MTSGDGYNASDDAARSYDAAISACRDRLLAGRELVSAAKEAAVTIADITRLAGGAPHLSPVLVRLMSAVRAFEPFVEAPQPALPPAPDNTPSTKGKPRDDAL